MEDSGEMHSEDNNKVSAEKNVKRRFKTPAQVMALENFFNEHKYPSEGMKLQLAEQIGLTEKQVSGWFCHRRLKEKRLSGDEAFASGRQDRSSGVIQDRGSGLRQDSCGSTKQGDYRNVDPREVESRRLYGHDFPAQDLAYDNRSQYTGNISGMDDTSSESSSSLRDRLYSQEEDPHTMEASRYVRQNGGVPPINPNRSKNKEYKPSGYLKVKGETENAAITAVKRQLGRNYREDGPPLGIEFEALPPGAFESPSSDQVNEPSYVGSSRLPHPLDVPGVQKQHTLGTKYEGHSSKKDFQDSYIEGENLNAMRGSDCQGMKSHHQMKQKSPLLRYSNPSPRQKSPLDMYEDSAGETPVHDSSRGYRLSSKHDDEGMRLDSVSNHHDPYGSKITNVKTTPLYDYDHVSPRTVQNSGYLHKPSQVTLGSSKSLNTEERGPSKKMAKVEKVYGEKKAMKHRDPARVKMHPKNEMTVAKRVKPEFPHRDYQAKASYAEIPPWTNQIKGSAADIPSSFSEDETAETSSSLG